MRSILVKILYAILLIEQAPGSLSKNIVHFHKEIECDSGSVISKLIIKSETLEMGVECNGFQKGEVAYNLTAVDAGTGTDIVLDVNRNQVQMLSVNGNFIITMMGEVSSGECAGDHMLVIIVETADDQKACQSDAGLKSLTVTYGYGVIDGKCRSKCTKGSGHIYYEAGVRGVPKP